MPEKASDPKVETTFGIDPMLRFKSASFGADPEGHVSENRFPLFRTKRAPLGRELDRSHIG